MIDLAAIAEIEDALDRTHGPNARRLELGDLSDLRRGRCVAAWEITLGAGTVRCPGVSRIRICLDAQAPYSEPLLFAPDAPRDFSWPHVESDGFLCLSGTDKSQPLSQRVLERIGAALQLLTFTPDLVAYELRREFTAYWDQSAQLPAIRVSSLLAAEGPTRPVSVYAAPNGFDVLVADDADDLQRWLAHAGRPFRSARIRLGWLIWLPQPLTPPEFPEEATDLFRDVPDEHIRELAQVGSDSYFVIGAETPSGPALVAAIAATSHALRRYSGAYRSRPIALHTLRKAAESARLTRRPVTRVDGRWVHGRGHDADYPILADCHVLVVGAGAIGASVARLLAQAGVGRLTLIDGDTLKPQNTSRHVLGSPSTGLNKAEGLAVQLRRDFPHLRDVRAVAKRFEDLGSDDLTLAAQSNLIISSGVGFSTDAAIDGWRLAHARGVAHAMLWTEEYAAAGHVVVRIGERSALDEFDARGDPLRCATDWPRSRMIIEAGCGNVFQPYGSADLCYVNALGTRACIDVLTGRRVASFHRVWLGSRESVRSLGGTCRDLFDRDFGERDV